MKGRMQNAAKAKGRLEKLEKDEKQLHRPEQCLRCGAFVTEMHCKVLCTNCGYMRDCNDQW